MAFCIALANFLFLSISGPNEFGDGKTKKSSDNEKNFNNGESQHGNITYESRCSGIGSRDRKRTSEREWMFSNREHFYSGNSTMFPFGTPTNDLEEEAG